jgi:hypothetical protein
MLKLVTFVKVVEIALSGVPVLMRPAVVAKVRCRPGEIDRPSWAPSARGALIAPSFCAAMKGHTLWPVGEVTEITSGNTHSSTRCSFPRQQCRTP